MPQPSFSKKLPRSKIPVRKSAMTHPSPSRKEHEYTLAALAAACEQIKFLETKHLELSACVDRGKQLEESYGVMKLTFEAHKTSSDVIEERIQVLESGWAQTKLDHGRIIEVNAALSEDLEAAESVVAKHKQCEATIKAQDQALECLLNGLVIARAHIEEHRSCANRLTAQAEMIDELQCQLNDTQKGLGESMEALAKAESRAATAETGLVQAVKAKMSLHQRLVNIRFAFDYVQEEKMRQHKKLDHLYDRVQEQSAYHEQFQLFARQQYEKAQELQIQVEEQTSANESLQEKVEHLQASSRWYSEVNAASLGNNSKSNSCHKQNSSEEESQVDPEVEEVQQRRHKTRLDRARKKVVLQQLARAYWV